ncbi:MAG: hydrogenase maturation protease [Burkholderiales bacterium]|nr:hydrogenase maturation protease [Burkholderiales bacterium]
MNAALLVFGWGNRSRGDDALGPLFVEQLAQRWGERGDVDFLDDYQLVPEHALDLVGRRAVLFVDACVEGTAPFVGRAVVARADADLASHALTPAALLQVYRRVEGRDAPPATLLAIHASSFDLGAAPRADAMANLEAALDWGHAWLESHL